MFRFGRLTKVKKPKNNDSRNIVGVNQAVLLQKMYVRNITNIKNLTNNDFQKIDPVNLNTFKDKEICDYLEQSINNGGFEVAKNFLEKMVEYNKLKQCSLTGSFPHEINDIALGGVTILQYLIPNLPCDPANQKAEQAYDLLNYILEQGCCPNKKIGKKSPLNLALIECKNKWAAELLLSSNKIKFEKSENHTEYLGAIKELGVDLAAIYYDPSFNAKTFNNIGQSKPNNIAVNPDGKKVRFIENEYGSYFNQ